MNVTNVPKNYRDMRDNHKSVITALENLGKAVREAGPIDEKTAHLIQLAAAVAVHSEGAVHSHVRRAMAAGAQQAEIEHGILLLTSTIGFPTVSAALTWARDVFEGKTAVDPA